MPLGADGFFKMHIFENRRDAERWLKRAGFRPPQKDEHFIRALEAFREGGLRRAKREQEAEGVEYGKEGDG